jgi:putative membrane-bound dehydrogenase-like protein
MHESTITISRISRWMAVCFLGALSLVLGIFARSALAQDPVTPVRALLIVGGCCHDYDNQKQIIKKGLEQSGQIEVTVVHQGGTGTKAEIELYRDPKWADRFDVILHNECFSDDKDPQWLARILEPHRKGKPGVVIHCAMHCYRIGNDDWFEFCGVTSRGHGPHYPHEVRNVQASHPIMEGFGAAWANPAGELYRIDRFWPTATPLATAKDRENGQDQVCVWTNDYRGTRVFGTTLGHHNETVESPEFIGMLMRGTLWAAGKLSPEYIKPTPKRLQRENLALGAKLTASSQQSDQNNLQEFAADGKRATRWCASGGNYPQWIQVDLGKPQEVHGVGIDWENAQAKYRYTVEASIDGQDFQVIGRSDQEGNLGNNAEHLIAPTQARHIKVQCLGASPGAWASIRELNVYGGATKEVSLEDSALLKERELLGECKLPEGFEATLFAYPPAVNYPVFVAAAPDGTLFVSSDKNGSLDRELKRGSIIRLKDIDRDGRADQSNLYVDNVDSPRGLVWDHDRLYVLHPPHLSAFIDENGDGVSDRQEILVKDIAFGFKDRPADHTSNGVTMGIDGWLYLAIGDFGFMNATGTDGRTLQFRGGGVVRVRPDGSGMELYSEGTRNILEVAMDPLLRGFARDNTNDGGGWDVRMHHFSGGDDHGYPRKYIHFPNEIVPPLADYGGGSGCGALFLDEPGWPKDLNDCVYTADWGRQMIFSHRLEPKGATVTIDQKEFLGIERATDLDVDGNSSVFAASWKGATFTYAGENVGYVVQLRPKGYKPEPWPTLDPNRPSGWLELLNSNSHRRRIEGQRGLLRYAQGHPDQVLKLSSTLASIADSDQIAIKTRIAAIFTIELIRDQWIRGKQDPKSVEALVDHLIHLASRPSVGAWAIRALSDAHVWDNPQVSKAIRKGLQADDARTNTEALLALIAGPKTDGVNDIIRHLSSQDALLRHLASKALSKQDSNQACFHIFNTQSPESLAYEHVVHALSMKQDPKFVEELTETLKQTAELDAGDKPMYNQHFAFLRILARQAFREGTWNGASWGTRPDTRGPYYQPEAWEMTKSIEEAVDQYLSKRDAKDVTEILRMLSMNRWDISKRIEGWMSLPQWYEIPFAQRIALIESAGSLPDSVLKMLQIVAGDPSLSESEVLPLLDVLLKQNSEQAIEGVAVLLSQASGASTTIQAQAWKRCYESDKLARNAESVLKRGQSAAGFSQALLISSLACRKDLSQRPEVLSAIDNLWSNREIVERLLEVFSLGDCKQAEPLVRRAILDNRPEIETIGKELASKWGLADLNQWNGPKISTLKKEEVLKEVVANKGDAKRGQQVFGLLGCAKCHDVKPTEMLRGPYLPNVAKTYKREQLTEAILMPSKSIAQGFVQNVFRLDDDRVVSGFVTKESPQKIALTNAQGEVLEIDVESISERKESPVSVMPEGLADGVPVSAVSDLISYLESLN